MCQAYEAEHQLMRWLEEKPKKMKPKTKTTKAWYKLSPEQSRYRKALKWVFSSYPRAVGRSTLLAIVYIEIAIEEGRRLIIIDHYGTHESNRHLMGQVKYILQATGLLSKYEWHFGEGYIQCIRAFVPQLNPKKEAKPNEKI